MTAISPGRRAAMDQMIELGIAADLKGAAMYDGMDEVDAIVAYAGGMLADGGNDLPTASMMAAGLAIRMHRSGGAP